MAGPSTKPKRKEPVFVPHPDDAADVRAAFDEACRADVISAEESATVAPPSALASCLALLADGRSGMPRYRCDETINQGVFLCATVSVVIFEHSS
jgi:hypothetical protein